MDKLIRNLQEEMDTALRSADATASNIIHQAELSFQSLWKIMEQLKSFVLGYEFKDEAEEIRFFKQVKPNFQSELIYQYEVYRIESNRPVGKKKNIRNHYLKELDGIELFFEKHHSLYVYHQTEQDGRDADYFIRSKPGLMQDPDFSMDMDIRCSTLQGNILAKLMAYERIIKYLLKTISAVRIMPHVSDGLKHQLKWTDSKVNLIELAYALYCKGCFNHGKAEIKQIIELLEQVFQIDLGNFYGVFQQNIRLRKLKSSTEFLDQLIEYLKRRMDGLDGMYRSLK